MYKRFQMTAIAVVLAAASTSSFATDQGAFFINGNVGQAKYHDRGFNDNSDTSGSLRAGYSWQSDVVDSGLEGGYVNLGTAKGSVSGTMPGDEVNFTAHAKGTLLGANIKYKFSNKIFISARGGWFHSTLDTRINSPIVIGTLSDNSRGNGAYAGVNAGYDITPHFSLGLGFDDYHARGKLVDTKIKESIGVFSGFAEYRF